MTTISAICVYCGSSPGNDPDYEIAARSLGAAIAANGIRLIYGGGTNGLMGAVADEVMKNGGKVTGIIPDFLMKYEASGDSLQTLDELVVTADMHERKHMMFERSDAFVTLPGGIGTLEEVVEMMTWAQLGRHTKPIVLANINGFWDPLTTLLEHMSEAGFIHTQHRVKPIVVSEPSEIVPSILEHGNTAPGSDEFISRM